jgi:alpha-L-rhamnosidase
LLAVAASLRGASGGAAPAPRPAAERHAVRVVDLRCEYLVDPIGIDVRTPRLSFRLENPDASARGTRQAAWRILVSSSAEALAEDKGDLWDSRAVASPRTTHIRYGGRPLRSNQEVFWKARAHYDSGRISEWSAPARWSMGLLAPEDWKARWIGSSQVSVPSRPAGLPEGNLMPDPWLRKTFVLEAAPLRAIAYVASVGYHELYVNGTKAGDAVLEPAATDHTKRARYVAYDVSKLLRAGSNALGLWLGVSWSIYPPYRTADKPQTPIALAQLELTLPRGRSERVVTDGTWKTHASPNTTLGQWNFRNFGGELYDATKELANWARAELDDSAWKPVAVYAPRLELSAETVEPNRIVKRIPAVAMEDRPGGAYRVDMGVNFAGWMEIDVAAEPGSRVDFLFSERPDREMTHKLQSAYVVGPSGTGTFRNRFNYHSGRFITVKGLRARPSLEDFRGFLVRSDYRRAARFESSSDLMNRLFEVFLWTFENLSLGGYVVDCPQRERMGYGGDAHATTEPALASYELGAFFTKWAQDWRDVQGTDSSWGVGVAAGEAGSGGRKSDGNLPYTAPTYWGGGGPAWSGFSVTLPWLLHRYYGDVRILEDNFRMIERWLEFLETRSRDDMLVRWGGQWDFLGDWLWPGARGVNGDTQETLFFNNCYWIFNLDTAARIAEVLERNQAARSYRARAEAVRRAVHAKFWNAADASYVNGFQAYLAIALLAGVPPEPLRPAVWKRLEREILVERKGHIWAGITGGAFLMKTLLEADRVDLMYEMASKQDYPSWGDMLNRGATTFWESWADDDHSKLHSSYLHIGYLFIPGLAGIRPDPELPGFSSFVIRPAVLADKGLTWVKGSLDTLHGTIESEWRVERGRLTMNVTVPANTTARLYVPTLDAASVRESGKPAASSAGVKPLAGEAGRAVFRLQAGRYAFDAPY